MASDVMFFSLNLLSAKTNHAAGVSGQNSGRRRAAAALSSAAAAGSLLLMAESPKMWRCIVYFNQPTLIITTNCTIFTGGFSSKIYSQIIGATGY
jgi:hypothetical protein